MSTLAFFKVPFSRRTPHLYVWCRSRYVCLEQMTTSAMDVKAWTASIKVWHTAWQPFFNPTPTILQEKLNSCLFWALFSSSYLAHVPTLLLFISFNRFFFLGDDVQHFWLLMLSVPLSECINLATMSPQWFHNDMPTLGWFCCRIDYPSHPRYTDFHLSLFKQKLLLFYSIRRSFRGRK